MPLEVRQMIVKSTVIKEPDTAYARREPRVDVRAIKEEVLEECRRLISELRIERGER